MFIKRQEPLEGVTKETGVEKMNKVTRQAQLKPEPLRVTQRGRFQRVQVTKSRRGERAQRDHAERDKGG